MAEDHVDALGDRLGDLGLACTLLAALDGPSPRGTLVGRSALKAIRPCGERCKSLLARAHREARLYFLGSSQLRCAGELGATICDVLPSALRFRSGEALLEIRERRLVGGQGLQRGLLRHGEAISFGRRGTCGLAQQPELLCHGGESGVGLMQS